MKFTRSRYPDYPGCTGAPCWTFTSKYLWADIDWNPRFPFGFCAGIGLGQANEKKQRPYTSGLDLNAPLGEPNRLYLNGFGWHVVLGLLTWHAEEFYTENGRNFCREILCRPHLTGMSRYRYHKTDDGRWVRNGEPEPMHWGWLTVERT